MIQSIRIEGLNGHNNPLLYDFNSDLNVITGQNGCGKTTILKIMWYINACRFDMLEKEVDFYYIEVRIDNRLIEVQKIEDSITNIKLDGNEMLTADHPASNMLTRSRSRLARVRKFSQIDLGLEGTTLFFPTFRRIEGGFGMDEEVSDSITDLSSNLSSGNHKFIASVSTNDIDKFISLQLAKINKMSVDIQQQTFKNIRSLIKKNKGNAGVLATIENLIKQSEDEVEDLIQPFEVLEKIFMGFFLQKGIAFNDLILGNEEFSISSDKLSAGEKQMLSFLCYNAFYKNATIFIDEPELSLHPDWQRRLMPTLLSQKTGNQYIIATHSPMIYSQYPDKEVCLIAEKGE